MAFIIKDRVKEGTTSTGTGDVSLGGAAATFDTFQSYMSNGDTTYYAIVHTSSGVDEWEVGLGTWNTGNTLTRTTVLAGSNGTSAVNFSSGTKDIFMTYPASKAAVAGEDVTFADITVTGTVDGRDVAADGTKLDGIDTSADVTDATTVAAAGALMKSGGTMTGNLILNADPTAALGAATKEYVDTIASAGIHYHDPVRVETPSALTASYNNGSSGVGATLTNNGTQAALVIDGVTMALNDRVLVYNQTDETHNGIYTVTNVGSASTNWVMTRATDADSYGASDPDSFGKGDAFFVKEGDTGAGELYVMTTAGTITFGTTSIHFSQVAETAIYNAGTGITLNGTTFSIGQDVGTTDDVTFNQVTADIIGNVTGNLTGDVTGNADTATALETARTIQLSGDVTGSASFDGSANINITAAVQDDSHAHVISNVDGLQTALDAKADDTITITAGNGLTGGGNLTANRTLNVGAGSGISVTADAVAHADTSTQASVNNSGRTYIQDITLDGFGHVTGLTSATETVTDTTYTAGAGLDLTGTTFSHTDTSSQASVNNANGTVIQDITLDTYGHITGLASVNLDGRYYTETEADSRFVNVTGDTMTGNLTAPTFISNSAALLRKYASGWSNATTHDVIYNGWTSSLGDYTTLKAAGNSTTNHGILGVADNGIYFGRTNVETGSTPMGDSATTPFDNATWGYVNATAFYHGSDRVFDDGYHPNADKWTTARSHTVTLTGDVTGTATQSVDGTGNKTWSITTTVGNDSHTHNRIVEKSTIDYGAAYLQWTDQSGNGGSNGNGNAPSNPTNDWYHHIIANHANSGGYYVDIAQSFHADAVYHRRLTNGTLGSWQRFFTDAYHPNADAWTTARTLTLSGDASGSVSWDGSANVTLSVAVANDSHTHDTRYTLKDEFDWRGTSYLTSTTTSALKTELLGRDVFDSYVSAFKTGWSYAGNGNLTDAGRLTELAGTSWLTWTDNSTDNTQGNFTALVIAPTTGGSAGKMFVYNDQGSGYAPGWREIWTSTSDGSGSGLDADLLDGQHASAFALANHTHSYLPLSGGTLTGALNMGANNITMSNSNITGVNSITINDPGEGIIFSGTTNITLYAIDDASDNIMNFSNAAELRRNNNKVWDAGNDGSGSGLDADLLDGQHGSYYQPAASELTWIDQATGNYGTVKVDDDRGVSWAGWAIRDDWVFMSNGAAEAGIYNDTDNEWGIKFFQNARTALYYNADEQFRTESAGVSTDGGMRVGAFGNPHNAGGIEVTPSTDEKIVLSNSNNPYIRWQEGTTDRFYIQWRSTSDAPLFRNQQGDYFDFMPDAATGAVGLRLRGGDDDTWGYLYANDSQEVGILDEGGSWAYRHANDSLHEWRIANTAKMTLNTSSLTLDCGTSSTFEAICDDAGVSMIRARGSSQGTGMIEAAQSSTYGGGIEYNGDNSPTSTGAGADYIAIYQRRNNTLAWTMRNYVNDYNWQFRGDVYIPNSIVHSDDTNTYIQFHASDQWRVVTGGGERLEVNSTNTTVQNNLIVNGTATFNGTVSGVTASARNGYFWENDQTITSNQTITDGKNAMSAGPITINNNVTVTIGDGEAWSIV